MKVLFQVQAARDILSPEEILRIVGPERIEHLKQKFNDAHPFFKAWVMLREGDGELTVISQDGKNRQKKVKWSRESILNSIRNLPETLNFYNRHNRDNSTAGRHEYGQKVADVEREIDGRLTAITVGYFPPGEERETAKKSDIISFEGDLSFTDKFKNVVAGITKYTGIALGRSAREKPGFADAFEVASVQAFILDEEKENEIRTDRIKPERTSPMSLDLRDIDFKDLMEVLDYRTLKKAFAYRKMRLHDFISPADATGDLVWNEEAGSFGWVGGDEASHELQEHIMRKLLSPLQKKISELQGAIAERDEQLTSANQTIFTHSARPLLERIAEAEGYDPIVLKLAVNNLERMDAPTRPKGISDAVWEEQRDKALKRHLENAITERKKLEELGAVFGETEGRPGERRNAGEHQNKPALGKPPGQTEDENPLVSYAKETG